MYILTLTAISLILAFDSVSAGMDRNRQSNDRYDVIVIGAGASGLAALTRLHKAGVRVLGIEAEGRIGGRVNTQDYGTGIVEFGAEWIHGQKNNIVYELATNANIHFATPVEMSSMEFHCSNGTYLDQNACTKLLDHLVEGLDVTPIEPVRTVDEYMNSVYETYMAYADVPQSQRKFYDNFNELFKKMASLGDSAEWTQISTKGTNDFKTCEGPYNTSWGKKGYRTLFDILLNKTSSNPNGLPIDIILNSEVVRVNWSPDPTTGLVSVETANGALYHSSTIIVTVSLGVLQERYETWFNPPLPSSKVAGINLPEIGTVAKLCLRYKTIWWDNRKDIGFLWTDEDVEKLAEEDKWLLLPYASHPQGTDNVLTFWLSGDNARKAETLPLDFVKEKLDWLVRKFLGTRYPNLQDSVEIRRSTWYSNPHFRGSYSYHGLSSDAFADPTEALREPILDPQSGAPLLLFAGEATEPNYFSTVHGAVESGFREADRILALRAKKAISASQD